MRKSALNWIKSLILVAVFALCGVSALFGNISAHASAAVYPTRIWGTSGGVTIKDDNGFDAAKGEVIADVNNNMSLVFDLGGDDGLDISSTPYLNIKGYVPAEVTRIKLNYKLVSGGTATAESYWYYPSDANRNITINSSSTEKDKSYFEYHGNLTSKITQAIATIQLYCYVSGSAAAEIQILGFAFDEDGTYDSFRAPLLPDVSAKYTVSFDLNGGDGTVPETMTDVASGSTITAPTAEPTRSGYMFGGWATAVSGGKIWDFSADTVTKDMTLYALWSPDVTSVAIRDVTVGTYDAEDTTPVIDETSDVNFAKGEFKASTGYRGYLQFNVGEEGSGAVLGNCNWLNMKFYVSEEITRLLFWYKMSGSGGERFHDTNSAWSKSEGSIVFDAASRTYEVHVPMSKVSDAVLSEPLDYIMLEFRPASGVTGSVVMLGVVFDKDGTYSDWANISTPKPNEPNGYAIAAPRSNGVVKVEEDGSQTLTYTAPRDYSTFDISITDFSYEKPIFEIEFTPSDDIKMGFLFPTVDPENASLWLDRTFGHKGFEGGTKATQRIDLQNVEELKNFTIGSSLRIGLYIDAKYGEGDRSITVHSVKFIERPPVSDSFYLGEPKATGDIVCMDSAQGYKIKYTAKSDDTSYINVYFAFNNYDPEYDIIKVDIQSYAGMRLGILVEHTETDADGNPQLIQTYLRSHHQTAESVFEGEGRNSLYYFVKAFGLGGKQLSGIRLYFEPPIDRDNRVLGEHTVMLYGEGITVVRSQDQDFEPMTMTVAPAVITYGEEVIFDVSTVDEQGEDLTLPLRYEYRVKGFGGNWSLTTPTAVGEYDVQIKYMGSLAYDYQIKTTTLTIVKINSTTPTDGVTIDEQTRIVTVAAGIEASLSQDFEEGKEVTDGMTVDYGATVYYRTKGDATHNYGDVLHVVAPQEQSGPVTPDEPKPDDPKPDDPKPDEPSDNNGETGNGSSGKNSGKKGCRSAVDFTVFPIVLLCLSAAVVLLSKKRRSE